MITLNYINIYPGQCEAELWEAVETVCDTSVGFKVILRRFGNKTKQAVVKFTLSSRLNPREIATEL